MVAAGSSNILPLPPFPFSSLVLILEMHAPLNANSCALGRKVAPSWSCTRKAEQTNKSNVDLLAFQPFDLEAFWLLGGTNNQACQLQFKIARVSFLVLFRLHSLLIPKPTAAVMAELNWK